MRHNSLVKRVHIVEEDFILTGVRLIGYLYGAACWQCSSTVASQQESAGPGGVSV